MNYKKFKIYKVIFWLYNQSFKTNETLSVTNFRIEWKQLPFSATGIKKLSFRVDKLTNNFFQIN